MPARSTTHLISQKNVSPREGWLRKHADYQRAYKEGKRQSLPLMTYFYAMRGAGAAGNPSLTVEVLGSRVGLTAGKVLGNAVERNRIKRRMRAAVRQHRGELTASVDVILHPRRTVLEAEFAAIARDVLKALRMAQGAAEKIDVPTVVQRGGVSPNAVEMTAPRGLVDSPNGN